MDDAALSVFLRAAEEALLTPIVRHDPAALEGLLAPEFREFGSSGRVFDRAGIVAALAAEPQLAGVAIPAEVRDFVCTRLAAETALVTYRIVRV